MFGKKTKSGEDGDDGEVQETQADGAADAAGGDEGDDGGAVSSMKSGDYMVHVFFQKLKEINLEDGNLINSMFKVESFGQKEFSTNKEGTSNMSELTYMEHIFVEARDLDKKDAESGKIMIRLMDKGFLKEQMVGQFEMDLSAVYLKKGHKQENKWYAFSNPNGKDFAKVQCYVKMSIAVTYQEDVAVELKEDSSPQEDPDIIMSPALNPKFYQVTIRLFAGHHLPMMDSGVGPFTKEKIDAYLKLDFKGKKYKTPMHVYQKNTEPITWNTEFLLPCQLPVAAPEIPIRLMDKEDISSDELAATLMLKTKDIIENKDGTNGKIMWRNLYGSPMGQSGSKEKRLMNEHPEFASAWKGRVLVQILAEPTEKPKALTQNVTDKDTLKEVEEMIKETSMIKYNLMVQVGQAVALPNADAYKMLITVGGEQITLNPQKQRDLTTSKKFEKPKTAFTFESYYHRLEDFESVIVQLMKGDDPVCFYKDTIENFIHKKVVGQDKDGNDVENDPADPERMEWYQFLPDTCVKKCKHPYQVGQFSFKMTLELATEENNANPIHKRKFWKKNQRLDAIQVRAYIYQARDLPAADAEGTSDPYVRVWDNTATEKKWKKTEVQEDNCNPIFFQVIDMEYEVGDEKDLLTYPPFIFDIWDYDDDLLDSTDDYMCRCVVEPEDCAIMMVQEKCKLHENINCSFTECAFSEVPKEPRWHPCFYSPGSEKCGELLVSFSTGADEYKYCTPDPDQVDLSKLVEYQEMKISMNILGMRNLASPGILPVKKAFVKFGIKSLAPPNSSLIHDKKTQPSKAGANPTLNTTINFSVRLPVDRLYTPKMTCTVYDNIFGGWNQPIIGIFIIDLGAVRDDLTDERSEETAKIEEINKALMALMEHNTLMTESNALVTSNNLQTDGPLGMSNTINQSLDEEDETLKNKDKSLHVATKKRAKKKLPAEQYKSQSEVFNANEDEGEEGALIQRDSVLEFAEKTQQELIADQKKQSQESVQEYSDAGSEKLPESGRASMRSETAMLQYQEMQDLKTRVAHDERIRQQESLISMGQDISAVIAMPTYVLDERLKIDREQMNFPAELYIPLGYDEDSNTKRKHYRKYFLSELEKEKSIFEVESPFNTFILKKGQARGGSSGMFSSAKVDKDGEANNEQETGIFKAVVEVQNEHDQGAYQMRKNHLLGQLKENLQSLAKFNNSDYKFNFEKLTDPAERQKFDNETRKFKCDHLNIAKALTNLNSDEILKAALLKEEKCIVRFYAIEGINMAKRDMDSDSDTYLLLKCNGVEFNERENYQLDEPNPKFNKRYDFEALFPGSSPMTIQVWDYDMIFGDELVGTSIMDLEDRYFTLDWMGMKDKPIESRQLYHPSSSLSQGAVKCWTEIIKLSSMGSLQPKIWDITPKPPTPIEVRICVLNCNEVPMMDAEGTCDFFVKGFFDASEELQETDTHYRNQDGKPDFQYRWIFKTEWPRPKGVTEFKLEGYDRDFFKSNDMVGQAKIDLVDIMEDVALIKNALSLNKKYYDDVIKPKYEGKKNKKWKFDPKDENKIWLQMWGKNKKGNPEKRGEIGVKIDIMPQGSADKNPVGKARDNPNHSPQLPQPEGRLELSFNPIKMFNQLVGPALRRKIYCGLCCVVLLAICIMILPNIISALVIAAI